MEEQQLTIGLSTPSCRRFNTLRQAEDHAYKSSKFDRETRHVIKTGDHFFSSNTAQIFFYERLLMTFTNGTRVSNFLTITDIEPW